MPERRFPPPWTVEELDACFVVMHNAGAKARLNFILPAATAKKKAAR
jgi:hypothetical protein